MYIADIWSYRCRTRPTSTLRSFLWTLTTLLSARYFQLLFSLLLKSARCLSINLAAEKLSACYSAQSVKYDAHNALDTDGTNKLLAVGVGGLHLHCVLVSLLKLCKLCQVQQGSGSQYYELQQIFEQHLLGSWRDTARHS